MGRRFMFPRDRSGFDASSVASEWWTHGWNGSTAIYYPAGTTLDDCITVSAYSFVALVKIDDITTTDNGAATRIENHVIWTGDDGHIACYLRKSGSNYYVGLTHSTDGGTTYVNVEAPITLGTWTRVHGRYTGTHIQIGVDNTWSAPVAAGEAHPNSMTKGLRVMRNYHADTNGGIYDTKGRIRDLFFAKTSLADDRFTAILDDTYVSRYGFPDLEAPVSGVPFEPTTPDNGNTYSASLLTASPGWARHDGARLAFFNGKWRKYGGWDAVNGSNNRIYSRATPGGAWTLDHDQDPSPPTSGAGAYFSRRHCFGLTELGGYLYVYGGDLADTSGGTAVGPWTPCDVWRTADGTTFERIAADVPWNDNALYMTCAYRGQLHVICGVRGVGRRIRLEHWAGTVEGSTITWTRLKDPPFAKFAGSAVVHDGKLLIIGGAAVQLIGVDTEYTNSTWAYDGDAQQWALQSSSAPWTGSEWNAACVYDGKVWAFNGRDAAGETAHAHYSTDLGQTWTSIGAVPWGVSHADAVAATEAGGIVLCMGFGGDDVYGITADP